MGTIGGARSALEALVLCQVLVLAGCSEAGEQPDTGPGADGPTAEAGADAGREQGVPDRALAEASPPDLPPPDLPPPDLPPPDLPPPDLPPPDLPPPDRMLPDRMMPDRMLPDRMMPDRMMPDRMMPDLVQADAAPTDAVVPPADGTPAGDTGTTGGPYVINKGEKATAVGCQLNRSMVRNAVGELFYCYRDGNAPFDLNIARSINGGVTWSVWAKKINTETFAYTLSGCTLAVDKNSNIYAVWHRYSYSPTKHGTYIRKYDPNAGTWGKQVTIREVNNKISTSAVALDSKGYVYVLCGHSANWRIHLFKSKNPYASALSFTDLGDPRSATYSQTGVLTIDSNDIPHVLFYDVYSGTGVIHHRSYSGGWSKATPISNAARPNDKPGPMAADALGNVHMLYVDGGVDKTTPIYFQYRKWSAGKISSPIQVFTHSVTQHGGMATANAYIVNIAANEATGDVYVVGRDMNYGGALVLYKKTPTATKFTMVKKLRPGNTGAHYYYMPRLRGTVYPSFNRTGKLLDIAYIRNDTTNQASMFLREAAP
jgi:hypothetical protein